MRWSTLWDVHCTFKIVINPQSIKCWRVLRMYRYTIPYTYTYVNCQKEKDVNIRYASVTQTVPLSHYASPGVLSKRRRWLATTKLTLCLDWIPPGCRCAPITVYRWPRSPMPNTRNSLTYLFCFRTAARPSPVNVSIHGLLIASARLVHSLLAVNCSLTPFSSRTRAKIILPACL